MASLANNGPHLNLRSTLLTHSKSPNIDDAEPLFLPSTTEHMTSLSNSQGIPDDWRRRQMVIPEENTLDQHRNTRKSISIKRVPEDGKQRYSMDRRNSAADYTAPYGYRENYPEATIRPRQTPSRSSTSGSIPLDPLKLSKPYKSEYNDQLDPLFKSNPTPNSGAGNEQGTLTLEQLLQNVDLTAALRVVQSLQTVQDVQPHPKLPSSRPLSPSVDHASHEKAQQTGVPKSISFNTTESIPSTLASSQTLTSDEPKLSRSRKKSISIGLGNAKNKKDRVVSGGRKISNNADERAALDGASRDFEDQISKVHLNLSPGTVQRAHNAAKYMSMRYGYSNTDPTHAYNPLDKSRQMVNLLNVVRWKETREAEERYIRRAFVGTSGRNGLQSEDIPDLLESSNQLGLYRSVLPKGNTTPFGPRRNNFPKIWEIYPDHIEEFLIEQARTPISPVRQTFLGPNSMPVVPNSLQDPQNFKRHVSSSSTADSLLSTNSSTRIPPVNRILASSQNAIVDSGRSIRSIKPIASYHSVGSSSLTPSVDTTTSRLEFEAPTIQNTDLNISGKPIPKFSALRLGSRLKGKGSISGYSSNEGEAFPNLTPVGDVTPSHASDTDGGYKNNSLTLDGLPVSRRHSMKNDQRGHSSSYNISSDHRRSKNSLWAAAWHGIKGNSSNVEGEEPSHEKESSLTRSLGGVHMNRFRYIEEQDEDDEEENVVRETVDVTEDELVDFTNMSRTLKTHLLHVNQLYATLPETLQSFISELTDKTKRTKEVYHIPVYYSQPRFSGSIIRDLSQIPNRTKSMKDTTETSTGSESDSESSDSSDDDTWNRLPSRARRMSFTQATRHSRIPTEPVSRPVIPSRARSATLSAGNRVGLVAAMPQISIGPIESLTNLITEIGGRFVWAEGETARVMRDHEAAMSQIEGIIKRIDSLQTDVEEKHFHQFRNLEDHSSRLQSSANRPSVVFDFMWIMVSYFLRAFFLGLWLLVMGFRFVRGIVLFPVWFIRWLFFLK